MKIHRKDIAKDLEREIVGSRMIAGVRLPSAAELAKKYSVSPKTADRALDHLAKRKLIVRKRGSGNFVLDNRDPDSRLQVGFLWWTLDETTDGLQFNPADVFFENLKALMDKRLINYKIFVENSTKLAQPLNREKKYDIFLLPAGVILNNREVFRSVVNVPIIIYGDTKYNYGPWHQVFYDIHPGFTAALKYCREQGIRKFFVPFKNTDIVCKKLDVLLNCAEELGFERRDFHICHIPENISGTVDGGKYCAGYFLEHRLRDHLIFSVSDFFAYGMQQVFKQENLKYSEDYSMISYDNFYKYLTEKNELLNISSITHPQKEHAEAVVDLIDDLTRSPGSSGCGRAYVTSAKEFIIR